MRPSISGAARDHEPAQRTWIHPALGMFQGPGPWDGQGPGETRHSLWDRVKREAVLKPFARNIRDLGSSLTPILGARGRAFRRGTQFNLTAKVDPVNEDLKNAEEEDVGEAVSFEFTEYVKKERLGNGKTNVAYKYEHKKKKDVFIVVLVPRYTRRVGSYRSGEMYKIYELVSNLNHQNIATYLDYGTTTMRSFHTHDEFSEDSGDNKTPYIVMEFANKGTLGDILAFDGVWKRLKPEMIPRSRVTTTAFYKLVAQRIRQIFLALEHIHKRGIAHGDLNMDNVLVFVDDDGNETLKINDFGDRNSNYATELWNLVDYDIRAALNILAYHLEFERDDESHRKIVEADPLLDLALQFIEDMEVAMSRDESRGQGLASEALKHDFLTPSILNRDFLPFCQGPRDERIKELNKRIEAKTADKHRHEARLARMALSGAENPSMGWR